MVIEINDKEFGDNNYDFEICVNGDISLFKNNEKGEKVIEIEYDDIVEIRAKNIVYSSKWGWVLILFYWPLVILSGCSDRNPFGLPFDAYIKFKTDSTYVKLNANKIWKKEAFNVLSGNLTIERNEFVSNKKYIVYWCLGTVTPINLLIIAIMTLFILLCEEISLVMMIPLICICVFGLIGWNVYVYKILKKLKLKHKD